MAPRRIAYAGIVSVSVSALLVAGHFVNSHAAVDVAAEQSPWPGLEDHAELAERGDRVIRHSPEDDRGGRVFHQLSAAAPDTDSTLGAERQSRYSAVAEWHSMADGGDLAWRSSESKQPERSGELPHHQTAKLEIASVPAVSAVTTLPTARPQPSAPSTRLASLDRQQAMSAVTSLPKDVAEAPIERSLSSAGQSVEASIVAETPSVLLKTVALPAPRPDVVPQEAVQLASLEPQVPTERDDDTVPDAMILPEAPLPQRRPAYQASVAPSQPAVAPRQPAAAPKEPSATLAYARPETAVEKKESFFSKLFNHDSGSQLPGARSGIAVYDIKAATVYLPNGKTLEAHSGLGQMQDNPRYVNQKNRGPTPPNVYNLVMREARFHGAEAIRLLPSDGKKKFNRDGLLAHPYMYIGGGDRSQSNGCVVFEDYSKFLAAFKQGQVKRLIVVPTLDELPTYMAAL
ncbi:DUF2778 domain-containing protein [Consotaella aegiceratis]|uniref:DUF2778 domain-containing protein n=1 Tax=Consotaella aegiceratis TaxID=3097961 RepID=UPI002F41BAE9